MLALRSEVFVVEQQSLYLDADGYDARLLPPARRLTPRGRLLAAYLRVLPPGLKYPEAEHRARRHRTLGPRAGLGRGCAARVAFLDDRHPQAPLRIGAQAYLVRFYEGFGFCAVGEVYDEDGIPHVDMVA